MIKVTSKNQKKSKCEETLSTGHCRREAIEGSDRCIFHDSEVWKHKPKLVRQKIKEQTEGGDFNFEGCHFPEIDFSEIIKSKEVREKAKFEGAHFQGDVSFKNITFHRTVDFSKAEFSGVVRFDHTRFGGDACFEDAKFCNYSDFNETKFSEIADFRNTRFYEDANFSNAEFFYIAQFRKTKFHEGVTFWEAEFNHAGFSQVDFSEGATFQGAKFTGGVSFKDAIFSSPSGEDLVALFRKVTFSGRERVEFKGAKFFGHANFQEAEFNGITSFQEARFSRMTQFNDVRFFDTVVFADANFSGRTFFVGTTFSGFTCFRGIAMDDVLFDFSLSIFHRELSVDERQWSRRGFRLKIENIDLERAIDNYHILRKVLLSMGHYNVAAELFYNEMDCKRKLISLKSVKRSLPRLRAHSLLISGVTRISKMRPFKEILGTLVLKRVQDAHMVEDILGKVFPQEISGQDSKPKGSFWKQFGHWLWIQIFYIACGFGERPRRVILSSFTTLFLFSLAYYFLITTPMTFLERIIEAIYLSLDCFVALGVFQNKIIPLSWRWLTYLEAGLGVALISLFLVVFTRKMARD